MKRYLGYIFCVAILFFSPVLCAQQVEIITAPYECDFEDSLEISRWVLNAGTDGNKCQDQWMMGSLDYHGGRNSLYISCDTGQTTTYSYKPNVVVAYKKIRVPDLTADTKCGLDISFDWKCMGDIGRTGLHFYFLPTNRIQPRQLNSLHKTGALPSALSRPDTSLYANYEWTTYVSSKDKFIVPEEAEYYLIFVWQNGNLNPDKYQPFAACIDNLQIALAQTPRPKDLNATSSNDTIWIDWGGSALNYEVQYRLSGKKWIGLGTMPADEKQNNNVMLTGVDEGFYEIRVRGRNSSDPKDCSCWITTTAICYIPDNHCINIADLDREGVTCKVGVLSPSQTDPLVVLHDTGRGKTGSGPVTFGETAISSRHQVNWTQDLFDPRTGGRLRTIPYGGLVSVRLGNWDINYETESIEFEYLVDTTEAKIILLKYAVVLEAPGHGERDDPFFKLELLDEHNRPLDSKCGDFDFSPESPDIEWFEAGAYKWKDWSAIGMNVEKYHGQVIKIHLLTRDCLRGGHAGYAYFTLDCLDAAIKSTSCGDEINIEMVAPEGFTYKWTKRAEPDKIISTKQVLPVPSNDTATYDCWVGYIGMEECGFNLFTSIIPRFPYPEFEYEWVPSNCENKIALINKSSVKTKIAGEFVESQEKLDYCYWTVEGEDWASTKMDTAYYIAKNIGDTVDMYLEVGLAGGTCTEEIIVPIVIPPIHDHLDTIYREICPGSYVEFDKQFIAKSGVYTEVLKNIWGCDSVTVLVLTVLPKIEPTYLTDTICRGESLKLGDETYSESGTYKRLLYSKKGCDSVIFLDLEVIEPLGILIDNAKQTACSDESVLSFEYDFVDSLRSPVMYSIVFDSLARKYGFVDQDDVPMDDLARKLIITLPDNCRPNSYSANFVFTDTTSFCGDIVVPVQFDVYYSSNILQPKFGNLITVYDADSNGGYSFVPNEYKWYRNDSLLVGETNSYLYLGDYETFKSEDCYYLEVKRIDDGVIMRTCEVCPESSIPIDIENVKETEFLISATLLNKGQSILIQNFDEGLVNIYSFTGQLIDFYKITSEMTELFAPNQQGFYLLELITTKDHSVYKIYVRDN